MYLNTVKGTKSLSETLPNLMSLLMVMAARPFFSYLAYGQIMGQMGANDIYTIHLSYESGFLFNNCCHLDLYVKYISFKNQILNSEFRWIGQSLTNEGVYKNNIGGSNSPPLFRLVFNKNISRIGKNVFLDEQAVDIVHILMRKTWLFAKYLVAY